jgi:hypothetical protein
VYLYDIIKNDYIVYKCGDQKIPSSRGNIFHGHEDKCAR